MYSMRFSFIRLLAVLLVSAMLIAALAGCGESEGEYGVIAANDKPTEPPVVTDDRSGETPPADSEDVSTESEPVEQPAPYGAGSISDQTVGTIMDGLQLINVRWNDHGSYFRVVFDLGTADGEPVIEAPHAQAFMSDDGRTVTLVLGGIRAIGSNPNAAAGELPISDTLINSIKRVPSMDDQALVYAISLSQPATYSLAGVDSPGRIVVDIHK